MTNTFIIAEMSANHCGDKELAKEIINEAKNAGADAVKIQTYTADTMTLDCHNPEFQIKGGLWDNYYFYDLYKEAYTPWEWQGELKQYADGIGIPLFSTPFDTTAVDFLESINVPMYKIASFEAYDYHFIKYAAKCGKPMIISTGISSLEEIQEAVDACKSVGNNDITLLKCTSAYPSKIEDMNLLTIKDMIDRFGPQGVKVGLSDHSMSIIPPVTAVAMGAVVIEKHFTLDRVLGGPDSGFSLNKEEFAAMVQAVRDTEKAMGKVDYTVNQANRGGGRSLYVAKDIKAGEQFTPENVRSVRPSCGLHPKYFEEILGKTAARDLPFGTALKKEDIDFRRKAMKFLVYFDGLNQLDRRGISLWNVSVCLVDIFLNTLKTTDFEIKLIIPQTAFFQYQYYKKLSVADRKKFSSLDGERLIPFYEAMKDNIIPIGDDELRNCFPDHMSLDEIYGATLEKRITPEQTANLKKVILGKLGNWRPDMVVAYPLTLNWLHDIFENTPVLVNEWAIFSRAPLPRSIYFDPCGSLDFSFLNKFKQEIQNYQLTEEQNRQVEAFKRKFVSLMNERMNVLFLMNPYLKKFEKLILVPLVGSYRVKDMSGFPDDATIIQEVMEKVPQNVGVIFTGHNQDKMSYGYVIAYQQKYPNFIYIPQLSSFGMQSPPVFPYVDAIVNHLSATGIMAMLWDIPVIPLDGHYNDWIKDADSLDDLEKVLSAPKRNKNNMIYWYMTHYAIFENRFNDAGFYKSFFINKLKKFKEKGITFDFYEKINDFQEVAEYTISVLKSAFSPYIQSKKTYRLFGIEIFKIKKVSGEKKYYIMGLPVAKLKKLPRGKKHLSILHIPVFTMKEK